LSGWGHICSVVLRNGRWISGIIFLHRRRIICRPVCGYVLVTATAVFCGHVAAALLCGVCGIGAGEGLCGRPVAVFEGILHCVVAGGAVTIGWGTEETCVHILCFLKV